MKKGQGIRETKKPMTHDRIYKIMLFVTFFVAGAFLVINLIKLNLFGIVAIGGSMLLFAGVLYYLKRNQVSVQTKEFVTAIAIEFLIFIISMFSGASFSDDFILFLAAIGVAGLYMEPKFTKTQIIVALVLLVVMPIIHSDKMESVGQYILCYVMFAIASYLYYLVIRRGRSFIDIAREHTSDSEKLLWAMQEMGEKLEYDFNKSSERIAESTKSLAKLLCHTEAIAQRHRCRLRIIYGKHRNTMALEIVCTFSADGQNRCFLFCHL